MGLRKICRKKNCPIFLGRIFFVLLLVLSAKPCFSQEEEFFDFFPPDSVRRPERDEAPRYPQDLVIGELGRGTAPYEAWLYARELLNAFLRSGRQAAVFSTIDNSIFSRIRSELDSLNPDRYRLGGGRLERDGSVSFLVRFLSRDSSMTGELFLYQEEIPLLNESENEDEDDEKEKEISLVWRLDDFLLEESRSLSDTREESRFEFSTYDRLY